MKVLFIGGTGIISSAVSRLAVEKGIELYHLNRGKSHRKIEGVKNISGDIRNVEETKQVLKGYFFDVVVKQKKRRWLIHSGSIRATRQPAKKFYSILLKPKDSRQQSSVHHILTTTL